MPRLDPDPPKLLVDDDRFPGVWLAPQDSPLWACDHPGLTAGDVVSDCLCMCPKCHRPGNDKGRDGECMCHHCVACRHGNRS